MRLWKVVLLLNLALLLGLGAGYLWWAREVQALRRELDTARRGAGAGAAAAARTWTVRGIVRWVAPEMGAVFLTHEAIPGLMEGMTMGFDVEEPRILGGLAPGDPVRFTVAVRGERLRVLAIERETGR